MPFGPPIPAPAVRATNEPMLDDAGDAQLVERARAGDRHAFDELVRRHVSTVYATLHQLTRRHDEAEDLAQEAFVRAYRALGEFRGGPEFGAWVRRIALRLAWRRRRGPEHASLDDAAIVAAGPSTADPADVPERVELLEALHRALERLPEHLRAAIVMRTLEGHEYDEIARRLDVRPATARTHVHQARARLVEWLAPWLGREGTR